MKANRLRTRLIFFFGFTLAICSPVYSSVFSWNMASGIWGTSSNWTPNGMPTSGDTANFTGQSLSSAATITVDNGSGGGVGAGVVNMGDSGGGYGYTFSGNSITMNNGSSNSQINQVSSSGGDTIASAINVGGNGNLDITNYSSSKYLTISGTITGTATTGNTDIVTVRNGSSGNTNLYGIADGSNGGTVTLVLDAGSGSIYLRTSNNSTFGGVVQIKSGIVVLGAGAGLGTSSTNAVTIDLGASLQMNGKTGINRNFILNGSGKGGKGSIINSTGTSSISAAAIITLASDTGFGPASGTGITLNGLVAGAGKLWLLDSGTLTLNYSNTYSGGTEVGTGTLVASASGALGTGDVVVDPGATLTLSVVNTVADTAMLTFYSGSVINLAYSGTETVGALGWNGAYISSGTYTASQLNSYFGLSSDVFYGNGLVSISAIPEVGAGKLILGGMLIFMSLHFGLKRVKKIPAWRRG